MLEFLLLDLDDTILDFHRSERSAISATIAAFGADPTEEVLARYHDINKAHWEMLERGEKTREQILVDRFAVLFRELGTEADAQSCARLYEKNLSSGHFFLPGAMEAVRSLHRRYRLFLASNGTASVQHSRIASAELAPWFEKIFISQEVGANKPDPEFFRRAFAAIPGFDPEKAMMVGDSLTSDIRGGLNAGIRTCWVASPDADPGQIRPHHRIESITQLEGLLDSL